jgi:hypothetical protein
MTYHWSAARDADGSKISLTRCNWRRFITAKIVRLFAYLSHILGQSLHLAHQFPDQVEKRAPGFLPDEVRDLVQLTIIDDVELHYRYI